MKTRQTITGVAAALAVAVFLGAGVAGAQPPGGPMGPPPGGPMGPPPGGGMGRGPMFPPPEALDADQDGTVTHDEFKIAWMKLVEKQFADLDANGDGVLEGEELDRLPGPRRDAEGRRGPGGPHMGPQGGPQGPPPEGPPPGGGKDGDRKPPFPGKQEMDQDHDGRVTKDEHRNAWAQSVEAMFKRMDANGDGKLDEEELAKRPGPPPPGGPQR